MKTIASTLLCFFILISVKGQILQPATWSYETSADEVEAGEEIELIFRAVIDPEWYLYSSDFDPNCGPMVTTFTFEENESFKLVGGIRPINPKAKFDEIFECDITIFEKTGEFRQTVKLLGENPVIRGSYEYQVCTDVDGKCIPFDDEFEFTGFKVLGASMTPKSTNFEPEVVNEEPTETENTKPEPEGEEQKEEQALTQPVLKSEGTPVVSMKPFFEGDYGLNKVSYLWFVIIAFLAGLAAIVTPCVFPMIPMTVAFFTNKHENKKRGMASAFFYGFSIVFIYTLFGVIVAPFMGPETANHLATEWLPNLIFSLVFFVFALSFFGLFDINIPHKFVNKMDRQADKGGFVGTFFMAFTLVLVSFSCTGPIVGTILVEAAGGNYLKPILGMFAFSMAFAIPFTLFAVFPNWLNSLPKSGGWLNSVKVIIGFIELALAIKFISIADQAFHWNLIDREVNVAIWIVIFSFIGFYLLGKIKLPGDSELKHIGVGRLLLSIISFSFVIYLIPGMFGAPLKALAGYLPPMHTHDFNIAGIVSESNNAQYANYLDNCEEPKHSEFLHLPHGLQGYFDFNQAMECAREQNKPLFIDFTGHGCVNCREMEASVWSDPKILAMLKNEFVVVALYVDDKTLLPEEEWYISAYDNKLKKTIGKQNADLQIQRAGVNAQPNYFILDHEEKALTEPTSYTSIEEFSGFLNDGIRAFDQKMIASGN